MQIFVDSIGGAMPFKALRADQVGQPHAIGD